MPTPDVRIRLSAEGVAEVVSALKKVENEGAKAGRGPTKSFTGLNSVLGNTKSLLAGLGVAFGVRQLATFVKGSIDAADEQGKFARIVGTSVENLSALHYVSRTNLVDLESMNKGLTKLNKLIGDAAAGAPQAVAVLKNLQIRPNEIRGQDTAEVFALIAKRLSQIPDPAIRGKLALDIFGRSGAKLLLTMTELSDKGLAGVREEAKAMGALISTDTAAAAEQLNNDLEQIKAQAQGLTAQFLTGLIPALDQMLEVAQRDVAGTASSWDTVGKAIGLALGIAVHYLDEVTDHMITYSKILYRLSDTTVKGLFDLFRGRSKLGLTQLRQAIDEGLKELEDLGKREEERKKGLQDLLSGKTPAAAGGAEGAGAGGQTPEQLAELQARRAQALQSTLDRELALVRSNAALREKAEKRAYDAGLEDVRVYYANRRKLAEETYAKEQEILDKKRKALVLEVDEARKGTEEGKIQVEQDKSRVQYQEDIAALTQDELDAVRALGRERAAVEQKILEAQGKTHQAALLGIDQELERADELYRKQGLNDEERLAELARYRKALTSVADFEDVQRSAQGALSSLESQRQDIQDQVDAGLLTQLQGEEKILALEKDRIETLKRLAAALLAAAEATGDPDKIAQAQQFADSVNQLGYAVKSSEDAFHGFRQAAEDAGIQAVAEIFDQGAQSAKGFGQAVKQAAADFLAAIRRMAAEKFATDLFKSVGLSKGGKVQGETKAEGGLLRGIGGPTQDLNLGIVRGARPTGLLFSPGEYLNRAAVVRQPGVLQHLENLNRYGNAVLRSFPRFAEGGYVAGTGLVDRAATAGTPASFDASLQVGLEPGLVLKELRTPEGTRELLKLVGENRRAFRAAQGIS